MKTKNKKYGLSRLACVVLMVLALLWLTISTPFVYNYQQKLAKQNKIMGCMPGTGNEEEATNPFGNNTEEKVPTDSNSFSEEYLHDHYKADYFVSEILQSHKYENISTYIAFHGEILVPPPNTA